MLLRWRAPELALLLANRAATAAGADRLTVLRAEHLAVFALNRLERHAEAVHRLLPAIRDPDTPVDLCHELHLELAQCAAALGEPAIALAALRPVLAVGEDLAPVLRGRALLAAAESSGVLGRADVVSSALEEADELFREDPHLDRDTALLLRASAKAVDAVCFRRGGATVESEVQARAGYDLLAGLADPEHDSGQVGGRLMLEIVLALLDRGAGEAAAREALSLLRRPVRAAAAGPLGWLRLALATRVHLVEGRHEPALALLADAVEVTQRHGVDAVLAECLEGLSHVHEVRGEFADALHCLRSARAAEGRHRRAAEAARSALLEHGREGRLEAGGVVAEIAKLLPAAGSLRAIPNPDSATGLLAGQEYACLVEVTLAEQSSAGSSPDDRAVLSQVLIDLGAMADEPPKEDLLVELSELLRDAAPEGSALGQILGHRIAVLLPATSRDQAQAWADQFRTRSAAELGAEIAVGVAQHTSGTGAEQFLADTVAALEADRDGAAEVWFHVDEPQGQAVPEPVVPEPVVPEPVPAERPDAAVAADPSPAAPGEQLVDETGAVVVTDPVVVPDPVVEGEPLSLPETRRRRGTNGTPLLVSDLLPGAMLSAGRPGRRRAEDRIEDRTEDRGEDPPKDQVDDHTVKLNGVGRPASRGSGSAPSEFADSGPPPAPVPRPLDVESAGLPSEVESRQVGMGHLLAEALAAFQESRHPLGNGVEPATAGTASSGDGLAPTARRDPQARGTPSLRLAPGRVDRDPSNPADALTDPELRLPDLTAEPLWRPPRTGRQSAVGD
ncbi:MAG TPA: hypothetical protein VFQ77_15895 [Pseudonocardiaceae bacterium]|nr:hypothetical protein [Pseudonocardiaceae bacterium]